MSNLNMIKPQGVQNIINKFCYTIGMLPTSYKISMTYEEQIIAIGKYLEDTVYPAINNNAEALAEVQNLFEELKDYVDNYFDNLDIQEEVNNKIDDMIENGTLENIINHSIFNELNNQITSLNSDVEDINYLIKNTHRINLNRLFRCFTNAQVEGCCDDGNFAYIGLNNGTILKVSMSTGQIISQFSNSDSHNNCLYLYNNLLYVANAGSNSLLQDTISVLNPNTMQFVSAITISGMTSIGSVALYENSNVVVGLYNNSPSIVITDKNWNVTEVIDKPPISGHTGQNTTYDEINDTLYSLYYPNVIEVRDNNRNITYMNIDLYAENLYFVGECEEIIYNDDKLYLYSDTNLDGSSHAMQKFVYDLKTNIENKVTYNSVNIATTITIDTSTFLPNPSFAQASDIRDILFLSNNRFLNIVGDISQTQSDINIICYNKFRFTNIKFGETSFMGGNIYLYNCELTSDITATETNILINGITFNDHKFILNNSKARAYGSFDSSNNEQFLVNNGSEFISAIMDNNTNFNVNKKVSGVVTPFANKLTPSFGSSCPQLTVDLDLKTLFKNYYKTADLTSWAFRFAEISLSANPTQIYSSGLVRRDGNMIITIPHESGFTKVTINTNQVVSDVTQYNNSGASTTVTKPLYLVAFYVGD